MKTRAITIHVPESVLLAEKTDEARFAKEVAMLAAVKLFELGRLSSGRAAELAGVSRVEFLIGLKRYQVSPSAYDVDELKAAYDARSAPADAD